MPEPRMPPGSPLPGVFHRLPTYEVDASAHFPVAPPDRGGSPLRGATGRDSVLVVVVQPIVADKRPDAQTDQDGHQKDNQCCRDDVIHASQYRSELTGASSGLTFEDPALGQDIAGRIDLARHTTGVGCEFRQPLGEAFRAFLVSARIHGLTMP